MSKAGKRFRFTTPLSTPTGTGRRYEHVADITIGGIYYPSFMEDYDIDEITYNNTNVLNLYKHIGSGAANEVDFIHHATMAHISHLELSTSDEDLTTDRAQG